MKKRICLFKDMVCATSLSYDQACKALELALNSRMGKCGEYEFFISGYGDKVWQLKARHIPTTKDFVQNPEQYMIEV